MSNQEKIRNFCIIAHIDHGKSTLADRLLERTESVAARDMTEQLLDNMELERERGITIKARAVRIKYKDYIYNLIDTPGHVDFTYEVSRSLMACEGAILVVDASQGVEAQTLANTYLAVENDLEIIPVVNKIDLPNADPERVKAEVEGVIGLDTSDAPLISAKNGINIEEVLEQVARKIPPPKGDINAPLKCLVFDSFYDSYKGVIVYVRVKDGEVKVGEKIKFMGSQAEFVVSELGYMEPERLQASDSLKAGEVGYIAAAIKSIGDAKVGDTITLAENSATEALPGFRAINPMVFSGIYPVDGSKYSDLREALERLKLNDAALTFELETSNALGFGFRCGFLGLLHMEITAQRLEREYNLDIITTLPSVIYKITKTNGTIMYVDNPSNYPTNDEIELAEEPFVAANILVPEEYVGAIMDLCTKRRGLFKDMKYLDVAGTSLRRVELHYHLPLNEIVYDFFDSLKSCTRGYASYDYDMTGYEPSRLVKLDIMLNGEVVDALSIIVHTDKAYTRGRGITEKLKDHIPRHLFEIPIQASVGGKIIARETVKAVRKDVLAKCYGGDITRKKKLLEKQKEGKKRMKQFGNVEVPQEAFLAVLKMGDD